MYMMIYWFDYGIDSGAVITPDGKYLFFSSDRREKSQSDVYWVDAKFIKELKPNNIK